MYQAILEQVTVTCYKQNFVEVWDEDGGDFERKSIINGLVVHFPSSKILETNEGDYAEYIGCDREGNEVYSDGDNLILLDYQNEEKTLVYTKATVSELTASAGVLIAMDEERKKNFE